MQASLVEISKESHLYQLYIYHSWCTPPYSGSYFPYGGIISLQHEVSLFFPGSSDVSLQHQVLSSGFNRPKIHCY